MSAAVTTDSQEQPPGAAHPAQRWGALYGLCYDAGRWLVIYQRLDGIWQVAAIYGQRDEGEALLDDLARSGRRGRQTAGAPGRLASPVPMAGQLTIDDAIEGKP